MAPNVMPVPAFEMCDAEWPTASNTTKRNQIIYAVVGSVAVVIVVAVGLLVTLALHSPHSGLKVHPPGHPIRHKSCFHPYFGPCTEESQPIHYLNNFIKDFEVLDGKNVTDCRPNKLPEEDQVCIFRGSWLTTDAEYCQEAEDWGYNSRHPCVLLTPNMGPDWTPDVFESIEELPGYMPYSLRRHIIMHANMLEGVIPKILWVSCEGESPAGEESLSFTYSPYQGFPQYYFPYKETPQYMSPLVAVQVKDPPDNVQIQIKCRMWAKNTDDLVRFELLMETSEI